MKSLKLFNRDFFKKSTRKFIIELFFVYSFLCAGYLINFMEARTYYQTSSIWSGLRDNYNVLLGSLVGFLGGTHVSTTNFITGLANLSWICLIFLNRLGERSWLQFHIIIKLIQGTLMMGLKSDT